MKKTRNTIAGAGKAIGRSIGVKSDHPPKPAAKGGLNRIVARSVVSKVKAKIMRPKRRFDRWIAPSMTSASGMTGIPIEAIKIAKKMGCEAFHANGNVDCDILVKFLTANPKIMEDAGAAINTDAEEALTTRAERFLKEAKVKQMQGVLIEADLVSRTLVRFAMELKRKLLAAPRRLAVAFALETEAIKIEERLLSEFRDILKNTSTEPWMQSLCPHCKKEIE